jgi:SAM-dependent methyltransferase
MEALMKTFDTESQQPSDGIEIIKFMIVRNNANSILDIGCGGGKWGRELKGKVSILDGVEVWQPYIVQFDLEQLYNHVYNCDIRDFNFEKEYDIAILGDVLEHLPYDDALKVVEKLKNNVREIYLIIPINVCIQQVPGRPFESHLYQWSDKEIRALDFKLLHVGTNENHLVAIGSYIWKKD